MTHEVAPDGVDRLGHLGVEAVGQPAQRQGQSQHQPDADDGDGELPGAKPQVGERDREQSVPSLAGRRIARH